MSGEISMTGLFAVEAAMLPLLALSPALCWGIGVVMTLLACGAVYYVLFVPRKNPEAKSGGTSAKAGDQQEDSTFNDLCQAHGLSREDAALMKRAAEELELPSPVRLFVDPSLLRRFAERTSAATCVAGILGKLFGLVLEAEDGVTRAAATEPVAQISDASRSAASRADGEDVFGVASSGDSVDALAATLLSDLPAVLADEEADGLSDEGQGDAGQESLADSAERVESAVSV